MSEYTWNDSFDRNGMHIRQQTTADSFEFLRDGRDEVRCGSAYIVAQALAVSGVALKLGVSAEVVLEARRLFGQLQKLEHTFDLVIRQFPGVYWYERTSKEVTDVLQEHNEEKQVHALIALVRTSQSLSSLLRVCSMTHALDTKQKQDAFDSLEMYEKLKQSLK